MKVSVIGLGKLGFCTAACFASRGHKVIGVEKNEHFIRELKQRRCPVRETGLAELLERSWNNFEVTSDLRDAVLRSEATFIIVPTPSQPDGRFSNEHVESVLRGIGPVLKSKRQFHVVDVVSTVMPGSCQRRFKPLLEELSSRICGRDFGLVYNPEFIALGSVIRDFLRPDMVLIGASDERSAGIVKRVYLETTENEPHIATMSLLNAEITKLSLNCFVTTKISFANELANICERLDGADVDAITEAIGFDTRVGGKYLRGGLGFGGTCFPRDNLAFQAFGKDVGYDAKLSRATVAVNDAIVEKLFDLIKTNVPQGGRVALLGLSYKPGTGIIEQSQSVFLAEKLAAAGYQVAVHDPAALERAKEALGDAASYYSDPYECVRNADGVALLTRWPEFGRLDWERIANSVKDDAFVIDSWRILNEVRPENLRVVSIGIGSTPVGIRGYEFAVGPSLVESGRKTSQAK